MRSTAPRCSIISCTGERAVAPRGLPSPFVVGFLHFSERYTCTACYTLLPSPIEHAVWHKVGGQSDPERPAPLVSLGGNDNPAPKQTPSGDGNTKQIPEVTGTRSGQELHLTSRAFGWWSFHNPSLGDLQLTPEKGATSMSPTTSPSSAVPWSSH